MTFPSCIFDGLCLVRAGLAVGLLSVKKVWRQCQMKLFTRKILALEKQICCQLQLREFLEWNTKTENKKLYAVTLYIECELKFPNIFLCVPFSILSIEYHVNYCSKSPYFSPYFSVSWISYNICLFVPCIYVHVFPNIFIPYNLPKHCTQSHHT